MSDGVQAEMKVNGPADLLSSALHSPSVPFSAPFGPRPLFPSVPFDPSSNSVPSSLRVPFSPFQPFNPSIPFSALHSPEFSSVPFSPFQSPAVLQSRSVPFNPPQRSPSSVPFRPLQSPSNLQSLSVVKFPSVPFRLRRAGADGAAWSKSEEAHGQV